MAVTASRDWLEEGMAILEDLGAEALTIETLTNRLSVTKGPFYHHFKNYMARLFYSIYVGSQHIVPPIKGAELAHLYQQALPLLSVVSSTPSLNEE